jgi:hypothetical protein
LEVVARRPILAGEILCLTYVALDGDGGGGGSARGGAAAARARAGEQRRQQLRDNFHFDCQCERCSAGQ